ncbi:MAG: hypothetical protein ABH869_02125 [Candidatus Omnitrophota bacterium]
MTGQEAEGEILFGIEYKDMAGNEGEGITDITAGDNIIFDNSVPIVMKVVQNIDIDMTGKTIDVLFDDFIMRGSAETFDNYFISGKEVVGAELQPDRKNVRLIFDEIVFPGEDTILVYGIADLAGNAISEGQVKGIVSTDNTSPTITVLGTSVSKSGDIIALSFDKVMNISTLSADTLAERIAIDFSNNKGNVNEQHVNLANAVMEWDSNGRSLAITLNEELDREYIPDMKYIGVTPLHNMLRDVANNAAEEVEVYSQNYVEREEGSPEISDVICQSVNNGADTITIVFDEVVQDSAGDIDNWTVYSDDNKTSGGETELITTNASAVLNDEGKIVTITLDENKDRTFLINNTYIKVVPDSAIVKDLAGNANVMPAYAQDAVIAENIIPTFTVEAASLHAQGDQIKLTFSEQMDITTLTNDILAEVLFIDHSNSDSNAGQEDIELANAVMEWDQTRQIVSIVLNEEQDRAYIPQFKYVGVTPVALTIKDLTGNAVESKEIYFGPVLKENVSPLLNVEAESIDNAPDIITITSDEVLNDELKNPANWGLYYDYDNIVGGEVQIPVSNAVFVVDNTNKIIILTLNEETDKARIPAAQNGVYIKAVADADKISDLAGNAGIQAGCTESRVKAEDILPILTAVEIFSNNSFSTSVAESGDVVTLQIETSELLAENPTVKIDGKNADSVEKVTNNIYEAKREMQAGDTIGEVSFSVDFKDLAGNAGERVELTTDGSSMIFDDTVLSFSEVTIYSDNDNTAIAKSGDMIILNFAATKTLSKDPEVFVDNEPADSILNIEGNTYRATKTIEKDNVEENVNFRILISDLFGNDAEITQTTDESAVIFDSIAPAMAEVIIRSNNTNDALFAKIDNIVTITMTVNEELSGLPKVIMNGRDVENVTHEGGNIYTAAHLMDEYDVSGPIEFSVEFKDLAGNEGDKVDSATDGKSVLFDRDIPEFTVTAESRHAADDIVVLNFSEPMITLALSNDNLDDKVELDYSNNKGNVAEEDIPLSNAVITWKQEGTQAVITLNEAMDGAYIPDLKFVGVTIADSALEDLTGNGVITSEIYSDDIIFAEKNPPSITIFAESINNGNDVITIFSDEVLVDTAETITNWAIQYDDNNFSGGETIMSTANAEIVMDTGKKIITITLDENIDGEYIPAGKFIKVVPHPVNIGDLAGNGGSSAVYTAAVISPENTPPDFGLTAASNHGQGDTIVLNFSEIMDISSLSQQNLKETLTVFHSAYGGPTGKVDINLTNALMVWGGEKKTVTITLDEEVDRAYIPNNRYIGIIPAGAAIKDLVGNTVSTLGRYYGPVSKESVAPAIMILAPEDSAVVNKPNVSYMLSEVGGQGTITWKRVDGGNDVFVYQLKNEDLRSGEHNILLENVALEHAAEYEVIFEMKDLAGNTAVTRKIQNIVCDTSALIIDRDASPGSNASVNTNAVSYDFSEQAQAGSIVWRRTGGEQDQESPHIYELSGAELSAGRHDISSLPGVSLADGAVYSVTFEGTDNAGNETTPVVNTNILYDITASQTALVMTKSYYTAASWNAASAIKGTTSDEGEIEKVEISIMRREADGDLCWNGEDWESSVFWVEIQGTTSWTYNLSKDDLTAGRTYIIRARAIDKAGNITPENGYAYADFTYEPIIEISGIADPIVAGVPSDITVSVKDHLGIIVSGYDGTIHFTSTDLHSGVMLPQNYTFNSGAHTFDNALILVSAGEQRVTATDTVYGSLAGERENITVGHAEADHLEFEEKIASPQTAGKEFPLSRLKVVDVYGNICDGSNQTTSAVYTRNNVDITWILSGESNGPENGTDVITDPLSFEKGISNTAITAILCRSQDTTITANIANLEGQNKSSNVITIAPAEITKMRFIQQPSTSCVTNQPLNDQPKIAIADSYGNSVTKAVANISVAASLTTMEYTPVINGTLEADSLTVATSNGVASFSGITYDYPENIYLRFMIAEYGMEPIYSPMIEFETFADAEIADGPLTETGRISSLATTMEKKQNMFDFRIIDGGADGFATKIKQITITKGADNETDDWMKYIGGAYITDGIMQYSGTVRNDSIIFGSGQSIIYRIEDGKNSTYVISLYLKQTLPGGSDNALISFSLDASDNIQLDEVGSSFSKESDSRINSFGIDIKATDFIVEGNNIMAAGDENVLSITAIDANGNIDVDFTGDRQLIFSGAQEAPDGIHKPTCTTFAGTDEAFGMATPLLFDSGVNSSGIKMKLYKAETAEIKAECVNDMLYDNLISSDERALSVRVSGGNASKLSWEEIPVKKIVANAPWKEFSVGVTDRYGNISPSTTEVSVVVSGGSLGEDCVNKVKAEAGVAVFSEFCVICDTYPGIVRIKASASGVEETSLSEEITVDAKYSIILGAKDYTTGSHLTELMLTVISDGKIVDGFPESGNSPFKFTLPYGTYTMSFSKEKYIEESQEKIAGVAADGLDGKYDNNITWSMTVTSLAEATADYHVQNSIVYQQDKDALSIRLWLERRGKLITNDDVNKLGPGLVEIYDNDQTIPIGSINMDAPESSDYTTGVYYVEVAQIVEQGGELDLVAGQSYYAKCQISYGGADGMNRSYQTGTTFEIDISTVVKEITEQISTVSAQIQAEVAGVKTDIESSETEVKATVTETGEEIKSEMSQQGKQIQKAVEAESAKMLAVTGTEYLPAKLDSIRDEVMEEIKPHVQSEILTGVTTIKQGETVTISYRTGEGLLPIIDVYDPNGNTMISKQIMAESKKEIGSGIASSIYEYNLTFQRGWGAGDFTIVCSEPKQGTVDALTITVFKYDIGDVASNVTAVLGITSGLGNVKGAFEEVADEMSLLKTSLSEIAESASKTAKGAAAGADDMEKLHKNLAALSTQIAQISVIKDYGLEKLYDVSVEKKDDLVYLKNKTQELKAIMELNQKMMDNVANEPVTQTWYEYGSVVLKAIVINPSKTQQRDVPFKAYLPKEVRPEHIMNKRDLYVAYDTQQGSYYVYATFTLKAQESKEVEIEMEDIWIIDAKDIDEIRGEARSVVDLLNRTEYSDRAQFLLMDIEAKLDRIVESQENSPTNPEVHISIYRENLKVFETAEQSLALMRSLLSQAKPVSLHLTWKIISAIIIFLGILSLAFYIIWQKQVNLSEVPSFEIEEEIKENSEEQENKKEDPLEEDDDEITYL